MSRSRRHRSSAEPDAQALTAKQAAAEELRSEKSLLDKKESDGAAELANAKAELAGHDAATADSRAQLEAAEKEEKALTAKIEGAQAVVVAAGTREDELVAEEREARAKYDEGKASASSQSAKSVLLNGLMAAKRDGKIPGIIGRLGSLGTIAPEYDVAISTACGALDNIVVADTPSAQACVALLREKQLGVATFLILDKQVAQWGTKMKEGFNCPKGASRLFDLVECSDDAHRAAFCTA